MSIDESPNSFGSLWMVRIYTEAFKRLGVPFEARFFPMARRAALADAGVIDGEPARIYEYAAGHPNQIRVEEAVVNLGFGLYTAHPTLQVQHLGDLIHLGLFAEYRPVILLCENALKPLLPPERISTVPNEAVAIRKLLAGRADVYCDLDYVVREALATPEFRDVANIRRVLDAGQLATYPYLHKKHADLAPRLAATLRQMKSEGLIESYRLQAERELGWK